jgi:hypothetical protein
MATKVELLKRLYDDISAKLKQSKDLNHETLTVLTICKMCNEHAFGITDICKLCIEQPSKRARQSQEHASSTSNSPLTLIKLEENNKAMNNQQSSENPPPTDRLQRPLTAPLSVNRSEERRNSGSLLLRTQSSIPVTRVKSNSPLVSRNHRSSNVISGPPNFGNFEEILAHEWGNSSSEGDLKLSILWSNPHRVAWHKFNDLVNFYGGMGGLYSLPPVKRYLKSVGISSLNDLLYADPPSRRI